MNLNYLLILILLIFSTYQATSPTYVASGRYVSTGVYQINTSPFYTNVSASTYSNTYVVSLGSYPKSLATYEVALALHSLNLNFEVDRLYIEISIQSQTTTDFTLYFRSLTANQLSLIKVCYIAKQPSYSDPFYIRTLPSASYALNIVFNQPNPQNFTYILNFSLSSLTGAKIFSVLNGFDVYSQFSGAAMNFNIYPLVQFVNTNQIKLSLQTKYDQVTMDYYSVAVIIWLDPTIVTNGLILLNPQIISSNSFASLLSYSAPNPQINEFNLFVGLKSFNIRQSTVAQWVNFQTVIINPNLLKFTTTNQLSGRYFQFDLLIITSWQCPSGMAYDLPTKFCSVNGCTNCGSLAIQYQYALKKTDKNTVVMYFSIVPDDSRMYQDYSNVHWSQAITVNIPNNGISTVFIAAPTAHLQVTVDYAQNLQNTNFTVGVSSYNPLFYPSNLSSIISSTVLINAFQSKNTLQSSFYPQQTYTTSNAVTILTWILVSIYLILFLMGFVIGKVYILQMSFVPQLTFISLICLRKVSPSWIGLFSIKYIFGFNYEGGDGITYGDNNGGSYMTYMEAVLAKDFVQNYNAMFAFILISVIVAGIFYFKSKKSTNNDQLEQSKLQKLKLNQQQKSNQQQNTSSQKIKSFFLFDIILYIVLWFSYWILFCGQLQIKSIISAVSSSTLDYLGIGFFVVNIIIYCVYFGLFLRYFTKFTSFKQIFTSSTQQLSILQRKKVQYFYVIIFAQKIIVPVIIVNTYSSMQFTNGIIACLNLIMVIVILVLKPYKHANKPPPMQQTSQPSPLIKPSTQCQPAQSNPNIRPSINYLLSSLIQMIILITNYFQSRENTFLLYLPIVILVILIGQVGLNIYFGWRDGVVKQDFLKVSKVFGIYQDSNYNSNDNIKSKHFALQRLQNDVKQNKQDLLNMANMVNTPKISDLCDQTAKSIHQNQYLQKFDSYCEKAVKQQIKKDHSIYLQVPSNNKFQSKVTKITQNHQKMNASQIIPEKIVKPRNILSVDQMLQYLARKNYQNNPTQKQSTQTTAIQNHHKIMKKPIARINLLRDQWQRIGDVDSSRIERIREDQAMNKQKQQIK